jgi:tetratricopeptide (TPR) repeat protein
MKEFIEFDHKVTSLVEPYDVAMAYLNFAHELDVDGDPTIPAFKAMHLFEEIDDPNGFMEACLVVATYLNNKEQYENSLNYLLLARDTMFDKTDNDRLKANVLNKLGFLHFELKDYAKAIDEFSNCMEMLTEVGEIIEMPKIMCTLGFIYQDIGKRDEANEMFSKAAKLAIAAGLDSDAEKYNSFIL